MEWLIEDWLPIGHRGMDTAPEGSFKTIWGCWLAVCIAAGADIFSHKVKQGTVLLVDEETPSPSLDSHLDRFAQGLGYNRYGDLPITRLSMEGFRFGRKVEFDKLLKVVTDLQPIFVRLDSLLAMLPGGRQAISENDCHLGETVRDDLNEMLNRSPYATTLLSAHSKKFVSELSLEDLQKYDMQSLVRGHGSIVGEGCDTGYIIKKISEHPNPTRFAIITKSRRQAIPMAAKVVYVEMREESYGKGWAKLEEISPTILPPSRLAKALYPLFLDKEYHSAQQIVRTYAFFTKKECQMGTIELLEHKFILNGRKPQTFILNPDHRKKCDRAYLSALRT